MTSKTKITVHPRKLGPWTVQTSLCWTNWTFGLYYFETRPMQAIGFDFGPYEILLKKRKKAKR